jgi:hypothetical protein
VDSFLQATRGDPASSCGKTDGEEILLMMAIEKDVFYVAYPPLSLEYWGMNLRIVFPGNVPGSPLY